ncbi:MAG: hypothetical protein PHP94_08490 [Eubacteriales bacterium]|nr:hypothetical protein [Eubacteriales bacterium]MDD4462332.1 hypothetical protein [Eubacteriales bacterium]
MQQKSSHGYHLLFGLIRPFTRQGILSFLATLMLALIPVIQIFMFPIAFLSEERWWKQPKKVLVLALKMLVVLLLMFAPALAVYLFSFILSDMYQIGPGWLYYLLTGLLLWLGLSALIRLPMALSHLAHGGTISEALDARLIKRLISAAFGRYVTTLLGLALFVFLMLFSDLMSLVLAYLYGALISAWLLLYLAYVTNRCYEIAAPQLGYSIIPSSVDQHTAAMTGAVRTFLSFLLAMALIGQSGLVPVSVRAFDEDQALAEGQYPKNQYTADEYDEAVLKYSRSGQLNKNTKLYYDSETGRFYVAAKPSTSEFQEVYIGFVADCLPVVSTIKNVYEWNKYRAIVNDESRSRQEREAARLLMYVKGTSAVLSIAGPLGKAASGVAGKTAVTHLVLKAGESVTDPAMQKLLTALDWSLWSWDRAGDASKLGFERADPYAPEVVAGLITPPVRDDGEAYNAFSGRYSGKLICPPLPGEMYGMTARYVDPDLVITVKGDGIMSVYYTFESSFEYEGPYGGAQMSGQSTMPVSWEDLELTQTESGYIGSFTSHDFFFTSTTRYSGEAYEGEGAVTSEIGVEVILDIEFTLNTNMEASAKGTITHKNSADAMTGASPAMTMTFDIRQ